MCPLESYVSQTSWSSLLVHVTFKRMFNTFFTQWWLMPQSHVTTGPVRFLSPVRFLPHKGRVKRPEEFYVGAVLVVTSGYGPRTAWHDCTLMVWSNNSRDSTGTPCDARAGIIRAPHGNLQCSSFPTGPARDPQGCRTASLRTRMGIYNNQNWQKTRTGVVFGRTGPFTVHTWASHGLFTISKPVRGP